VCVCVCVCVCASAGAISKVISGMWLVKEIRRAIRRCQQAGFEPTSTDYSELVLRFSSAGRVEDAAGFFNDMIKLGLKPEPSAIYGLIEGHLAIGDTDTAVELYDIVRGTGVRTDARVKKRLISRFLEARQFRECLEVLSHMLEDGNVVGEGTVLEILGLLLQENQMDLALKTAAALEATNLDLRYFYGSAICKIAENAGNKLNELQNERARTLAVKSAYRDAKRVLEFVKDARLMSGPLICLHLAIDDISKAKSTLDVAETDLEGLEAADQSFMLSWVRQAAVQIYVKEFERETSDEKAAQALVNALKQYQGCQERDSGSSKADVEAFSNAALYDHGWSQLNALLAKQCCKCLSRIPENLHRFIIAEAGLQEKVFPDILDLGVWFYSEALATKKIEREQQNSMMSFLLPDPQDANLKDAVTDLDDLLNIDMGPSCDAQILPIALHYSLRDIAFKYLKNEDVLETAVYGDGTILRHIPEEHCAALELVLQAVRPPIHYVRSPEHIVIPRTSLRNWVNEYVALGHRSYHISG